MFSLFPADKKKDIRFRRSFVTTLLVFLFGGASLVLYELGHAHVDCRYCCWCWVQ